MAEKIDARFIIQIAGKPIENVEKALKHVLEKLKGEKEKFKVIESDIEEAEYDEETKLYSGFIDVMARFSDSKSILEFILDYTPTSIEIESPENLKLSSNDMTGILNDMTNFILGTQNKIRQLNAYVHMQNKKIEELEGKKK
ncbi:MAG: hypothetical protein KC589_02300 [Nanoarchaeota archaeon]|nr:hypothetical protein [Nanoarchaeota archaeon]